MSYWLFTTVVSSSLLYQNYQLSHIQESCREIERSFQAALNEQARLAFIKEKIYTIRKGLELASQRVEENPHRALFFSHAVQNLFRGEGITTASFPEYSDKDYFDQTLNLVKEIRSASEALLADDQRQVVEAYLLAKQCASPLAGFINAQTEFSLLADVEAFQAQSRDGDVHWRFAGCLLPPAVVFILALAFSHLRHLPQLEIGESFLWSLVITSMAGLVFASIWRDCRREANFKRFLIEKDYQTAYHRTNSKSSGMARDRMNVCRQELMAAGFDPNRSIPKLKSDLEYFIAIIGACKPIIELPSGEEDP